MCITCDTLEGKCHERKSESKEGKKEKAWEKQNRKYTIWLKMHQNLTITVSKNPLKELFT